MLLGLGRLYLEEFPQETYMAYSYKVTEKEFNKRMFYSCLDTFIGHQKKVRKPENRKQLVTYVSLNMARLRVTEGVAHLELWLTIKEPAIGNNRLTQGDRNLNAKAVLSSHSPISHWNFLWDKYNCKG